MYLVLLVVAMWWLNSCLDLRRWQVVCLQLNETTSMRLDHMIREWMSGEEKIWKYHSEYGTVFTLISISGQGYSDLCINDHSISCGYLTYSTAVVAQQVKYWMKTLENLNKRKVFNIGQYLAVFAHLFCLIIYCGSICKFASFQWQKVQQFDLCLSDLKKRWLQMSFLSDHLVIFVVLFHFF